MAAVCGHFFCAQLAGNMQQFPALICEALLRNRPDQVEDDHETGRLRRHLTFSPDGFFFCDCA
jgi:hypothetical protein